MYIILWLIFGAVVGWIASIVMKKNASMGLLANIIIGLIGSAIGMWLMDLVGYGNIDSFSFAGFIVSVGGASLLIAVISAVRRG
ncbi:MAG: GlsB/YeaQ/YmgE family stress response membrane protein [Candidatus Izemoplasmataceae bacterium]